MSNESGLKTSSAARSLRVVQHSEFASSTSDSFLHVVLRTVSEEEAGARQLREKGCLIASCMDDMCNWDEVLFLFYDMFSHCKDNGLFQINYWLDRLVHFDLLGKTE